MKKILITGGPVHAYLDDVKLITNRFKGRLMCKLIDSLFCVGNPKELQVTYLTSKTAEQPANTSWGSALNIVHHDGFDDYHAKVIDLSKVHDTVVLGAAVANLIPKNRIHGKFPSHNYEVGDTIPIEFTIAPRVIEDVKKVNPNAKLFGFKLLSNATHDELVRAAYDTCLHSRATAVFANDTRDLSQKYAVTKERSVIPMAGDDLASFIWRASLDRYYTTEVLDSTFTAQDAPAYATARALIARYKSDFTATPEGFIFGSVAVRDNWGSFVTTGRGKKELESFSWVQAVNHRARTIRTIGGKASLNAPLMDRLFRNNTRVKAIVHRHNQVPGLPEERYAFPGTESDSARPNVASFNILHHGSFLLLDKDLNTI